MQVLIDATSSQDKMNAGIGQYTKNIVRHLVEGSPEDQFTLLLYNSPSGLDHFINCKPKNLVVIRVGNMPPGYRNSLVYGFRIHRAIRKFRKENPQFVYFCPYFLRGYPAGEVPTVLMLHDFALAEFDYYSDNGGIVNKLRKLEYWSRLDRCTKVEAVITPSVHVAQQFVKHYPSFPREAIYPIHLGVEMIESESEECFKYFPADFRETSYLIYMGGGVQKNKNSESVIKAYKGFLDLLATKLTIPKEKAPYLLVAGKIFAKSENPRVQALHSLVEEQGIKDKVIFSGYYDETWKYGMLKNAFAFIHLSLSEGFGISVAEAMRAGIPVIAHQGSSYIEVVGDAGLLVDGNDPNAVAEAVYQVFTNKELAERLAKDGHERSLAFDWKKTAKETSDVLRNVSNKSFSNKK